MGLDNIIKNNPDWDTNVNSIYINNNICKSMKELNRALEKDFQNAERNNEMLKRHLEKQNPNFIKLSEKEKQKKKRQEEEKKKIKSKFNNDNYFD
jgi:hypothetical protein